MAPLAPMNDEYRDHSKDLRTVGRSADGDSLELHDLDGHSYSLRITDHLRSLVNQPTSSQNRTQLHSVSGDADSEISIKEIQARLRAGESMESISQHGNVSLEKVERYSQPILQERSYIISLAQKCELKKLKSTLLEVITEKLSPRGVEMKSCEWNTYRNDDGTWQIILEYPTRDGKGSAAWRFESVKRRIESDDDGARWIMDEEPAPVDAIVRPIRGEEAPPRLISIRSTPTPTPASESPSPLHRLTPSEAREFDAGYTDSDDLDEAVDDVSTSHIDDDSGEGDELLLDMGDEQIPSDARRDGVTRKVSIPSWDDIMFGTRKNDPKSE
jgi:hypothetical protein